MAHVFISYAHIDRVYARKLADHLLASGFDVWIDDRIDFGSNWEQAIFEAVDTCAAFVVVMSPAAYRSQWVQRERLYAEAQAKPPFPLLLDGSVFPFYIAIQYYDVRGGKLPDPTFIEQLAQVVPRRTSSGQDLAAAPQQSAQIKFETTETKPAPLLDSKSRTRSLRRRLLAAIVIMLGCAAVLLFSPHQQGDFSPEVAATLAPAREQQIVFQSEVSGKSEIYTINADGTGGRSLTEDLDSALFPSWSPDGAQIAFMSWSPEAPMLYVMNADGSNVHRLGQLAEATYPAWSPDGTQVAFTSYWDDINIHFVNTDGTGLYRVTSSSASDESPSWSPDGSQIAFMSDRDGNNEIYVINTDGTDVHRLTDSPGVNEYPRWSPDGSRIAFQSDRGGNMHVYIMNADGSDPHAITHDPADGYEPAWSPDGSQIAFMSYLDGEVGSLYVMDADGSNVRRVTDDPADDEFPVWRP